MIYRRFFNVPTWGLRSPLDELHRMRQQLDRIFEDAAVPQQSLSAGVFPLVNLTEDKDSYYVRAELPGVNADDLDIQLASNNLAISGQRKIHTEKEDAKATAGRDILDPRTI